MKIKIKEWCLKIASLGAIGYLPFGAQVAALSAFPPIFVFGWLSVASPFVFYLSTVLCLTLGAASIYGALACECDQHPGVIVIQNLLGMLIVFMYIPLTIKFAAIGFLLFYLAKYAIPALVEKVFGCELERWPLFAALLGVDLAAGFLVNIFLQFVWWMAH